RGRGPGGARRADAGAPGGAARGNQRGGGAANPPGQWSADPYGGDARGGGGTRGGGAQRSEGGVSILLDERTRVIIQGFTGDKGTFHAKERIAYGSNVVVGGAPGQSLDT